MHLQRGLLAFLLAAPGGLARAERVDAAKWIERASPVRGDFSSSYLSGKIRICPKTVWPEHTESLMMPFMAEHREAFRGKRVLDIGTGSGIMALYAAQLGAAKVVATEINPKAVACARENARRLGLESVVETRLVALRDPSAFSVIGATEAFDLILSVPPGGVDRVPSVQNGSVDEGVPPNDSIDLGLSIIDGLSEHLSGEGAAVLLYKWEVLHDIMVGYARHRGFMVEHHPAKVVTHTDWCALYNTFALRVAREGHLDPGALLMPIAHNPQCRAGPIRHFARVDSEDEGEVFPPLWGNGSRRTFPGLMVIRKPSAAAPSPTDVLNVPGQYMESYFSSFLGADLRICGETAALPQTEIQKTILPFLRTHGGEVRGKRVLAIGMDSGTSALYAARLGASKVVAGRIEPGERACVQDNIRKLGFDSVVEARPADADDSTAFSGVLSTETFDVVVFFPPGRINRTLSVSSGSVREEIPRDDTVRFGFSFIDGLGRHLRQGGAAFLYYGSAAAHNLMVGYALHRGYGVTHHPALSILDADWCALYNVFAAQVARTEHLAPAALLKAPTDLAACGIYGSHRVVLDWDGAGLGFPRLWGDGPEWAAPGMIAIQTRDRSADR